MAAHKIPSRGFSWRVREDRFKRDMTLTKHAIWLNVSVPTLQRIINRHRVLRLTLQKVFTKIEENPLP